MRSERYGSLGRLLRRISIRMIEQMIKLNCGVQMRLTRYSNSKKKPMNKVPTSLYLSHSYLNKTLNLSITRFLKLISKDLHPS